LRIVESAGEVGWPLWIYSGRAATAHEDQNGIDFVFETEFGPMFVQVKAGGCDPRKRRRYEQRRIGLVTGCLKSSHRPRGLRAKIILALEQLRLLGSNR
jgi:hypothetical protein